MASQFLESLSADVRLMVETRSDGATERPRPDIITFECYENLACTLEDLQDIVKFCRGATKFCSLEEEDEGSYFEFSCARMVMIFW